jgi:ABC-type Mn2+/Zn2+ transport system ATPase subunit
VLFLDEVFSSIDLDNITLILSLLRSFAVNYKINIFVVHHAVMNKEYFNRIITIQKDTFTYLQE